MIEIDLEKPIWFLWGHFRERKIRSEKKAKKRGKIPMRSKKIIELKKIY